MLYDGDAIRSQPKEGLKTPIIGVRVRVRVKVRVRVTRDTKSADGGPENTN